jgi:hypothetical protein
MGDHGLLTELITVRNERDRLLAALREEVACYHAVDGEFKRDYARVYKAHKVSKSLVDSYADTKGDLK